MKLQVEGVSLICRVLSSLVGTEPTVMSGSKTGSRIKGVKCLLFWVSLL